jgi:hypothetical protein
MRNGTSERASAHQVVIVGGGFGGLQAVGFDLDGRALGLRTPSGAERLIYDTLILGGGSTLIAGREARLPAK